MKILMFGWEFPPWNSGGLGTACEGLSAALIRTGAQVIFVLPKKFPIRSPHMRMIFAHVDSYFSPYVSGKNKSQSFYNNGLLHTVLGYAESAQEIVRMESFDIIHAHDWLTFKAGIAVKEISGKPLVVHVHATEFDRTGDANINPEVYAIEKEGMEKADKIIAVSNYTKNIIVHYYGISPKKIEVVWNGINSYIDSPTKAKLLNFRKKRYKIVLFVGRITLQKGPDYFVKAAKKILKYVSRIAFIIVGSGDMMGQMVQEAARLKISDRIFFAGFLRGEELDMVYRSADCLVMPSVSEPFGLIALESAQRGTPVIISKQSGVAEVLKHALKVNFWDIDEITNKVVSVLKHKPLRKTLSIGARREAQSATWDKAARQCIKIYQECLVSI